MTKFVGKPYAGKLHVRFDEGVGKVFCLPALLYCLNFSIYLIILPKHKGLFLSDLQIETLFLPPYIIHN